MRLDLGVLRIQIGSMCVGFLGGGGDFTLFLHSTPSHTSLLLKASKKHSQKKERGGWRGQFGYLKLCAAIVIDPPVMGVLVL